MTSAMRWMLALCALCWMGGAAGASAADRKVGAEELSKRGFFQDFDELDLSTLLESNAVQISIAARRDEPLNEASGAVSLVTAQDIDTLGLRTLEEVLRTVPGFDVLTDSLGRTRIVVRGVPMTQTAGSSEGVLILLDGHRLNEDVNGGATSLNLAFPVAAFQRIEILRGPASALYGEGAATAVINLVTERPQPPKPGESQTRLRLNAGTGSHDQQEMGIELGGSFKDVGIIGFIHYADSSGARRDVPADAQTIRDLTSGRKPVSLAPGRTKDDVRTLESLYRVSFKDWQLLWRMKQEQSGGFIGLTDNVGTQNRLRNNQVVIDILNERRLGTGTLRTSLGLTRSRANELYEVIPPGFERLLPDGSLLRLASAAFLQAELGSMRVGVDSAYDVTRQKHDLTFGGSLARESMFGVDVRGNLDYRTFTARSGLEPLTGVVPDLGRTVAGLWAQDIWRLRPRTTLTGALRLDHIGGVGTRLSPRVVVIHLLPHDMTLRGQWSRAYRAPSFRELAFDLPTLTGNPMLRATSLQSLEVGLSHQRDQLELAGSIYRSWLRDPVGPQGIPSLERPATLVNWRGANITGLELSARRYWNRHSAFLSYSLQDANDAATGAPVADVSTHVATLGGTFVVDDRLSVSPHWIVRSPRARGAGDPRSDLAGYGCLNLSARRLFFESKRLELRVVLRNLLDQGYRDPSPAWGVPGDYPLPGRSLYVDAKYRF